MRSTFSLVAAAAAGSLFTLLLSHAVPAQAGDVPSAAPAQAGACPQYSVVTWSASQLKAAGTDQFKRVAPEGWEPFASYQNISNGNAMFAFRRCGVP